MRYHWMCPTSLFLKLLTFCCLNHLAITTTTERARVKYYWEPWSKMYRPNCAVYAGKPMDNNGSDYSMFIGLAAHEDSVIPGNYYEMYGVTVINYKGEIMSEREFDVLCSGTNGEGMNWVENNWNHNKDLYKYAVFGGYDNPNDGHRFYVCRVGDENSMAVGYKTEDSNECNYAYYGRHDASHDFALLIPDYEDN